MSSPRPGTSGTRRQGRNVIWRTYIPEDIAVKIELLLADPNHPRPVYGARSQLVTSLLIQWLSRMERQSPTPATTSAITDEQFAQIIDLIALKAWAICTTFQSAIPERVEALSTDPTRRDKIIAEIKAILTAKET